MCSSIKILHLVNKELSRLQQLFIGSFDVISCSSHIRWNNDGYGGHSHLLGHILLGMSVGNAHSEKSLKYILYTNRAVEIRDGLF